MKDEIKNDTNNQDMVEQNQNSAAPAAPSELITADCPQPSADASSNPLIPESLNPGISPSSPTAHPRAEAADLITNSELITGHRPAPDHSDSAAHPATDPSGPPEPLDSTTDPQPTPVPLPTRGQRPRVGKVANLPPEIREWVNLQLLDEVPYDAILDELDERGHGHITRQNLTNWRGCGGYEQWLAGHMARQQRRAEVETVCSYITQCRGQVDEAAMLILSNQLLSLVSDYDLGAFRKHLAQDPQAYISLIKAVARLGKVRQASRKISSASLARKPSGGPNDLDILPEAERGLTEETLKKITDAIRLF